MDTTTFRRTWGKGILTTVLTLILVADVVAQTTFTRNNGATNNVWITNGNWDLGTPPNAGTHTAVFPSGVGSGVLRLTNGSSGTITIGTIIINNPAYTGLNASVLPASSAASINFGTLASIVYAPASDRRFNCLSRRESASRSA